MLKHRIRGNSKIRRNTKRPGHLQITKRVKIRFWGGGGGSQGEMWTPGRPKTKPRELCPCRTEGSFSSCRVRASKEPPSRGGLEHGQLDWFHEKSELQCFWKAAWKNVRSSDSGSTSAGFKLRLCSSLGDVGTFTPTLTVCGEGS